MPSPRTIALESSLFDDASERDYCPEEGCPRAIAPQARHDVDVRAHAAPQADPPAPCKNLRRDK